MGVKSSAIVLSLLAGLPVIQRHSKALNMSGMNVWDLQIMVLPSHKLTGIALDRGCHVGTHGTLIPSRPSRHETPWSLLQRTGRGLEVRIVSR